MLQTSPQAVLTNMAEANSTLCIIGRQQKLTDLPPFFYLSNVNTSDGRSYSEIDGVGAVPGQPNTAVTESGLLWLEGDGYTAANWEVITVHEVGHAIEDIGISPAALSAAQQAFSDSLAKRKKKFTAANDTPYAWTNYYEFWGVLTEAWFQSTSRTDINAGITTRLQLLNQEPTLAALFRDYAYGAGTWSYLKDAQLPHNQSRTGRRSAIEAAGKDGGKAARGKYRGPSRDELRALAAGRQPHEIWVRP